MEVKEGIGKAKMYDLLAFIAAKQSLENGMFRALCRTFLGEIFQTQGFVGNRG